ncbi:MAG TPA: DUF4124 domain-containing protein [Luteimonas sp.]|nr:DUF4124 domain-containing protein [Luteimonas sp.]
MRRILPVAMVALLPCAAWSAEVPPAAQAGQAQVKIYRCTDGAGDVVLRDTPCEQGSEQEVRTMLKPKDAPPAPPPPPAPEPAAAPAAPPRVVVLRAPRPMYECVTPDGRERYTSDSPEGNPRWVPLWTLGVPMATHAGTWVRDDCHALPQAEACARLRDDRREIDRRYFNAQPSEQARLRLERRALQARLDADCG